MNTALYAPMLSLMLLTMVVWFWLYVKRIGYMKTHNIHPQRLFSRVRLLEILPDDIQAPANSLNNLLELPIVFYALCLLNSQQSEVSHTLVVLAWIYVVLRVIHSLIHCTYNKVMHRFAVYSSSSLVLWTMLLLTIFRFV
ncbi:MAG TPA: MAPEG family protein [Agitococcus sp.]|nr:MAPEG family protein [Agitococcus sp.]